jgi:ribosomal protein S8
MKKSSIRNFLCELKNLIQKKHFFLEVDYNKVNKFLALFLTKEGFFRGFFLRNQKNSKKVKIFIILKYDEREKSCFSFINNKNVLLNKIQFNKQKDLIKHCNGLSLVLVYTIRGFISNEVAFWLKLGGKKIIDIK